MESSAGRGRRTLLVVLFIVFAVVGVVETISGYLGDGSRIVGASGLAAAVGALAQLLSLGRQSPSGKSRIIIYIAGMLAVVSIVTASISDDLAISWIVGVMMIIAVFLTVGSVVIGARAAARARTQKAVREG